MDADQLFDRYRELQSYVGWSDADAERVVASSPLLEPYLLTLIDEFYDEIDRHPNARKVVTGGPAQVERLKGTLVRWIRDLLSGKYDADYVARRWRVGWRHVEIGLDQVYTNVALSRLRTGLIRSLHEAWQGAPSALNETVRALNKLLDLDLAIIEDAYQAEYVARLQRSERLATLGQVAGGVAHELRNPLNVVKTSVYYLMNARNLTPEKQTDHLRRIERNVDVADGVITALSNFAKVPIPILGPTAIEPMVREALEFEPAGQGDRGRVRIPARSPSGDGGRRPAPDCLQQFDPQCLRGDAAGGPAHDLGPTGRRTPRRVGRRQWGRHPGRGPRARHGAALLDQGPRAGLGTCNQPFDRGKESRYTTGGQRAGPRQHFHGPIGRLDERWSSIMTPLNTHRILVVDDDPDICRNLSDILTDLGYQVDYAHDGLTALELIRHRPYAVALLDLKMPGMDGLTLYRQIKKQRSSTVSLLVTAFASTATVKEALAAGTWKVVSKPVDFRELLGLIDEALGQPLVLIVDDDQDLCANLWDLLRERGFRVCLAHDAREAASRLQETTFKVVLIDMRIPEGDGSTVFRAVRAANPQARTILITGHRYEMDELIDETIAEGADAVCYKPFQVPELLDWLEKLVGQNQEGAGHGRR